MVNPVLKRQRKLERRLARKRESEVYYSIDEIRDILSNQDCNCVFELNAPEKLLNRLSIYTKGEWFSKEHIDQFRESFKQSILYCLNLGIDRINKSGDKE
jgi:hypothetical protein